MKPIRIAVIGGGITGLVAAWRLQKQAAVLQKRPIDVTVYEASNRLGGKIMTYRESGLTLEAGPDSMLARKPAGMRLLRELGLESDVVYTNPAAAQTYIVRDGQLELMPHGTFVGIPGHIASFLQNTALSPQGKLRALFDLFIQPSHLDGDVSLGAFLRHRLGDEWVNYLGEPLLAGIYAGRIDELSLRATWNQFAELASKHRSLIIGARAMRSRQTANASGRSAFVTVKSGLESVIRRLVEELEGQTSIASAHEVLDIGRREDGYELTIRNAGGTVRVEYDAVIVATPVAQMNALLGHFLPTSRPSFDVPYRSTATIILGYPTDCVNVDLSHASGFLVPRNEGRAITASTWLSSKWPHAAPSDVTVLRCYIGRAGQEEPLALDDDELGRLAAREVKALVGLSPSPLFTKVTRWSNAMPNYLVGHLDRCTQLREDLRTRAPGIYIAGAGYEGLGLPDCIAQGEQAADDALAMLSGKSA